MPSSPALASSEEHHQLDEGHGDVTPTGPATLRLLRPHQWAKNAIVLAPLVFSASFLQPDLVARSAVGMALFSLAASAGYVFNDLRDREDDRLHPVKRHTRPIAAGEVSVPQAWGVLAILVALLLGVGLWVSPAALTVILGYVAITGLYSAWLKAYPVVDLFAVALGFLLRVLAGAVIIDVALSAWMGITTLCLALYLVTIKRLAELREHGDDSRGVLEDYDPQLLEGYALIAGASTVVFYGIYAASNQPLLALTVPLVLFGLFRYSYLVRGDEAGTTPLRAALSDPAMLATVGLWGLMDLLLLWPGDLPW